MGIAGTGGTSESSSALGGFVCTLRILGAGSLEVEAAWPTLRCVDPIDVLWGLKLVLEATDRPELYDLRLLTSGVVRNDDGVEVFRGIIDGDREAGLFSSDEGTVRTI